MTLPLLGPLSLTGFQHLWWLALFVIIALALAGLYVMLQISARKRLQRFFTSWRLSLSSSALSAGSSAAALESTGTRL